MAGFGEVLRIFWIPQPLTLQPQELHTSLNSTHFPPTHLPPTPLAVTPECEYWVCQVWGLAPHSKGAGTESMKGVVGYRQGREERSEPLSLTHNTLFRGENP